MGPNEFEDSGEFQGVGKVTVRHVIDCVQPHHQGVYTCVGQAREQIMASDPVAISVEGMDYKLHRSLNKIPTKDYLQFFKLFSTCDMT